MDQKVWSHTYQRSVFCCAQKIHSEGKTREDLEFKREGKLYGLVFKGKGNQTRVGKEESAVGKTDD